MEVILIILAIFIIGTFFENSDYDRMKEAEKLPPFTKKEAQEYYKNEKIFNKRKKRTLR